MKRFLVIDTFRIAKDGSIQEFTHFIDLKDPCVEDLQGFIEHVCWFQGQTVQKVRFSDTRMSNW